jgi:hypothetical protein
MCIVVSSFFYSFFFADRPAIRHERMTSVNRKNGPARSLSVALWLGGLFLSLIPVDFSELAIKMNLQHRSHRLIRIRVIPQ